MQNNRAENERLTPIQGIEMSKIWINIMDKRSEDFGNFEYKRTLENILRINFTSDEKYTLKKSGVSNCND